MDSSERKPERVLNTWKLMFVAFFLTCGGPYGIEPMVEAAGPALTLLGLLIIPIVYALPQSLMTAELSSMMDENGGYVLWVNRAFGKTWCGDFVGFLNAWNSIVDDMIDNALYVSIFVDYITQLWPSTVPWTWPMNITIIVLVAIMNTYGIDAVSWVSAVLLVVILGPILIELGYQVEKINPRAQWFSIPPKPDLDLSLFLSTLLWLYGGWDSLGTLAGEVKDPEKTYIRGIGLALVLNTLIYTLPIIIGLTVSTRLSDWDVGFFEDVAARIAPWLQYWVLAGSVISNFGTYNAGMAATARAMWAMGRAEPKQLPGIFGYTWSVRGTPLVAIIGNSIVTGLLLTFDFSTLVQCDTFLDCFTLLLEFASFMWLKYKEPDTPRPYCVPGGILGAWAITIPKVIVIGLTFYFTDWPTARMSFEIIGGIIVLFFLRKLLFMLMDCRDRNRQKDLEEEQASMKHTGYFSPYAIVQGVPPPQQPPHHMQQPFFVSPTDSPPDTSVNSVIPSPVETPISTYWLNGNVPQVISYPAPFSK